MPRPASTRPVALGHAARPVRRRGVVLSAVVALVATVAVGAPAASDDAVRTGAATSVALATPPMPPMTYNGEIPGVVGSWGGYSNGQIPTTVLCSPSWQLNSKVRCDAAAALEEMNVAYKARFGSNLWLTSTYRTYDEQVRLKAEKGKWAATPGTSNHGWALAIDFGGGVQTYGSEQHNWMRANANRYGWFHPKWAQIDGSLPEPWHWEYGGAVASGRTGQSQALAMELVRTQPWNSAEERTCLADLWQLRTGWNHRTSRDPDVRGIPLASMRAVFGSSWTSSIEATRFQQVPQRQIEWGLKDITDRYGSACGAWAVWGPVVTTTVESPTTVPAGGATELSVAYAKERAPVPAATLHVQALRAGEWTDVAPVPVVDGVASALLEPGSTTTTFRVRNWDASAVSAPVTVFVAEVTATLTGPTTVPADGTTSFSVLYTKDAQPVPAANVTLQARQGSAWVDVAEIPVVDGVAEHTFSPGSTTTTYRVRNWNTSTVTEPFTIAVAEVRASLTGQAEVMPRGTTTLSLAYLKNDAPVPSAILTVQELQDGAWVDVATATITDGSGTHTLQLGLLTSTFRVRNFDGAAVSEPVEVVVVVPTFPDVPESHPMRRSVDWLAASGITTGYADGTFRPGAPIDRDAMAAFLHRMAGSPAITPPATSPFADVPTSHPFYPEIAWLHGQGISRGTTLADGTVVFRPGATVSREAMAAFLHRFAGAPEIAVPEESPFADVGPGSAFFAEIAWLHQEGVTTGTTLEDGRVLFDPRASVTREAMAAFLHRFDSAV